MFRSGDLSNYNPKGDARYVTCKKQKQKQIKRGQNILMDGLV
jgi:hypothetical protein